LLLGAYEDAKDAMANKVKKRDFISGFIFNSLHGGKIHWKAMLS
jgi:hypothetical protein